MRAFVAMEVPGDVLDSLSAFQGELARSGADLKLVERENLHFTVKFLGEISDAQAKEADSRLKRLSLRSAGVEVKGVGAFPSSARPRVVWAGGTEGKGEGALLIAKGVIGSLEGIGEKDDRPFQLHLTLGRVRSDRGLNRLQELLRSSAERSFGSAGLSSIKLKSSQLTPSGPIYRDLGVYPLV